MSAEVLSLILGQLMPPIVEVVNSKIANKLWRYGVAMLISIILGFVTVFLTGEFNNGEVLGSIGAAFLSSQTAYYVWFKNSRIEGRINATFE